MEKGVELHQVQLSGSSKGLSATGNIQLAIDVVDVGLDRAESNNQRFGDLSVRQAIGYQLQHFHLALAEGLNQLSI